MYIAEINILPANELNYATSTVAQSGLFTMVGINSDCGALRFKYTYSMRFSQNIFILVYKKKARNAPVSNLSPVLGVLCALCWLIALLDVLGRQSRDKIPHFVPLVLVDQQLPT